MEVERGEVEMRRGAGVRPPSLSSLALTLFSPAAAEAAQGLY